MNWLDEDGYPTDEALEWVSGYDFTTGSFNEFVRTLIDDLWWMPDWGVVYDSDSIMKHPVHDRQVIKLTMSTGGWSGNELLISAMHGNLVFWHMTWWNHRAGGHYTFYIPVNEDNNPELLNKES